MRSARGAPLRVAGTPPATPTLAGDTRSVSPSSAPIHAQGAMNAMLVDALNPTPVLLVSLAAALLGPAVARADETSDYDQPPMLQEYVEPVVADSAVAAARDSVVLVMVALDESGVVQELETVAGDSLLRAPALAAVRQWVFSPGYRGRDPVPVRFVVPVRFYPSQPSWRGSRPPWVEATEAEEDSAGSTGKPKGAPAE